MYVCVHHVRADAHSCQRRVPDPLALGLQLVVSCPAWVLRMDLWSSAPAASVLKLRHLSNPCVSYACVAAANAWQIQFKEGGLVWVHGLSEFQIMTEGGALECLCP